MMRLILFVLMGVLVFILTMDMGVRVDMVMGVTVNQISMPMSVIMVVGMLVGVLQGDGVPNHEYGCDGHNGKTAIELHTGANTGEEKAESNA